jgi:hypothetical protein
MCYILFEIFVAYFSAMLMRAFPVRLCACNKLVFIIILMVIFYLMLEGYASVVLTYEQFGKKKN